MLISLVKVINQLSLDFSDERQTKFAFSKMFLIDFSIVGEDIRNSDSQVMRNYLSCLTSKLFTHIDGHWFFVE